jgi:hypothetical protein
MTLRPAVAVAVFLLAVAVIALAMWQKTPEPEKVRYDRKAYDGQEWQDPRETRKGRS